MIPELEEDYAILQMDSVIGVGSRRLMYPSIVDCLKACVSCFPFRQCLTKPSGALYPCTSKELSVV
jgi:hypothetical protein